MGNIFYSYKFQIRHWWWMLVLGTIVCSSAAYLVSALLYPLYQTSLYVIIENGQTTYMGSTKNAQAVYTFAQLLTTSAVLNPVLKQHPGMSMQSLLAMISAKPQTTTQIIELDVQARDPHQAANLANQIGQSFVNYENSRTNGQASVQLVSAQIPSLPDQLPLLENAGIGAISGLMLALILAGLPGHMSQRTADKKQSKNPAVKGTVFQLPAQAQSIQRLLKQDFTTTWSTQAQPIGAIEFQQSKEEIYPSSADQLWSASELQLLMEQETLELPTLSADLFAAPEPGSEQNNVHLPDTGENEKVRSATSKYIIRPFLSLSGSTMPTNGLTKRVFQVNSSSDTSSSLQNS